MNQRSGNGWVIRAGGLIAVVALFAGKPVMGYEFTASGSWALSDGQLTGTWQASFDVAAGQLGGFITVSGLPGISEGHIAGSMNSPAVAFSLSRGDRIPASWEGTVAGSNLSGQFNTTDGASGSWQGTFQASSPGTPSSP
jgi:hypothetical protein